MVRRGRVAINGTLCEDPFVELAIDGLVFTVDGVDWPYAEFACLMLHKPLHYECSRKPKHHPGVLELLPVALRERDVQPIGRLDEDTSGLLLITNDGQLNHQLSSAKRKVPKIYLATTKHSVEQELIDQLLAGVLLADEPEPIAAAAAEKVGEHLLRLTLTSGKYHQVKRMVAAAGNRVEALHREAVGELQLPADLLPGEWRWLSADDLQKLDYTR
jgi:16S rRNA pseudouridine516 synthase